MHKQQREVLIRSFIHRKGRIFSSPQPVQKCALFLHPHPQHVPIPFVPFNTSCFKFSVSTFSPITLLLFFIPAARKFALQIYRQILFFYKTLSNRSLSITTTKLRKIYLRKGHILKNLVESAFYWFQEVLKPWCHFISLFLPGCGLCCQRRFVWTSQFVWVHIYIYVYAHRFQCVCVCYSTAPPISPIFLRMKGGVGRLLHRHAHYHLYSAIT